MKSLQEHLQELGNVVPSRDWYLHLLRGLIDQTSLINLVFNHKTDVNQLNTLMGIYQRAASVPTNTLDWETVALGITDTIARQIIKSTLISNHATLRLEESTFHSIVAIETIQDELTKSITITEES